MAPDTLQPWQHALLSREIWTDRAAIAAVCTRDPKDVPQSAWDWLMLDLLSLRDASQP
jgi:hypothetical protein